MDGTHVQAHLDEEVMHLALREIRLLKACAHPNVVQLHEAFKSKSGRVYMVRLGKVDELVVDFVCACLCPGREVVCAWCTAAAP